MGQESVYAIVSRVSFRQAQKTVSSSINKLNNIKTASTKLLVTSRRLHQSQLPPVNCGAVKNACLFPRQKTMP